MDQPPIETNTISSWMAGLPKGETEPTKHQPQPAPDPKPEAKPDVTPPPAPEKKPEPAPEAKLDTGGAPETQVDSGTDPFEALETKITNKSWTPKDFAALIEEIEKQPWPRSQKDWVKLKTKNIERVTELKNDLEALRKDREVFETKVKEFESKPTPTADDLPEVKTLRSEVERLTKEAKDYSDRLAVAEVTSHPQFVAYYQGKVNEQLDLAKDAVGADKAEETARVLAMADSEFKRMKLDELSADLTPFQQSQLGLAVANLRGIERERQAEIKKAESHREQLNSNRQKDAEKALADNKKMFSDVVKAAQDPKNGMAVYQLRDGDDKWNADVQARIKQAETILFGGANVKPQEIVRGALAAAAFPTLLASYRADVSERDTKIKTLEAQVKELSAAQPGTGTGQQPAAEPPKPPQPTPGQSFSSVMGSWMKHINQP